MADLTDAEKRTFISNITGILQDADNLALFKSKEWDPTQRAINLANGTNAIVKADGVVASIERTLKEAVEHRRDLIEDTYALASATVGGVDSALGKTHALAKKVHGLRGAMSHVSPRDGAASDGDSQTGASGTKPT